jgi:hypothetical protein
MQSVKNLCFCIDPRILPSHGCLPLDPTERCHAFLGEFFSFPLFERLRFGVPLFLVHRKRAWLPQFDDQILPGQRDHRFLSKTGIAELIEVALATVGSLR